MSIKQWKRYPELGFFLDNNLRFTTSVFTWGLANDLHICKKYEPLQNMSF